MESYLIIVEESAKKLLKRDFSIWGKFTPIMKSWESCHPVKIGFNDIIFADVSNFILKSDGIGLFL